MKKKLEIFGQTRCSNVKNFKKTIKNMVMMRDQNHICHINYKLRQFSENLYLDKVACSELDLYPKIKSYFGMERLKQKDS